MTIFVFTFFAKYIVKEFLLSTILKRIRSRTCCPGWWGRSQKSRWWDGRWILWTPSVPGTPTGAHPDQSAAHVGVNAAARERSDGLRRFPVKLLHSWRWTRFNNRSAYQYTSGHDIDPSELVRETRVDQWIVGYLQGSPIVQIIL